MKTILALCCLSLTLLTALGEEASQPGPEARERLRAVLAKDPENLPALLSLGELEYRARRFEEAQEPLRKATLLQPGSARAWLLFGIVCSDAGKFDAALAALTQAVWLEPKNARAHGCLGVTLGRKGWRDGAEAELQRALELDDTLADAHFNLAVVYLQETPPPVELARRHYYRALDLGAAPDKLVEKQINGSKE